MHGHSFDEGALSRVRTPPMSTCTRVLYDQWNHYGGALKWNSAIRPDELTILTLTLVQPEAFKQHLDRWDIPCSRLLDSQR